jgi:hypothetical protein
MLQVPPVQHGWPLAPQLRHVIAPPVPAPQVKPMLQVLPAQHGPPLVPQAVQVPLTHAAVADAQRPAQHA